MAFKLPPLPYAPDALEPVISSRTIEFHYNKHHQGYVNNLNKLIKGTDWEDKTLEEIIRLTEGGIYNNAAQVWNHTFYWESFVPGGIPLKSGPLLDEIVEAWKEVEFFMEQFRQASVTLFGSGWTWLLLENGKDMKIMQGPNAWNPLSEGHIPLLTCDVWEHAYYLDYQNRRPDYLNELCKLLNWEKIEERFISAREQGY